MWTWKNKHIVYRIYGTNRLIDKINRQSGCRTRGSSVLFKKKKKDVKVEKTIKRKPQGREGRLYTICVLPCHQHDRGIGWLTLFNPWACTTLILAINSISLWLNLLVHQLWVHYAENVWVYLQVLSSSSPNCQQTLNLINWADEPLCHDF